MKVATVLTLFFTVLIYGCASTHKGITPDVEVELSELSVQSWTADKPIEKAYREYQDKYISVSGYLLVYIDDALGAHPTYGLHQIDLSQPLVKLAGVVPNERGKKYQLIGKIIKTNSDYVFDVGQWHELKNKEGP